MSFNPIEKSVLVYDSGGLFCSMAELLTQFFGRVGYFYPWETSFPDGRELMVGFGVPGVGRVKYFDREYKNYDLIVFPDVWSGDLQEDLRQRGHRVWGSGMGSNLELQRWETKEKLKKLGMDMMPCEKLIGTRALREYLKDHPDQYVKISAMRGIGETCEAKTEDDIEGWLLELESRYRDIATLFLPFTVEQAIHDAKEVGYDGWNIDGEFPETAMFGIEKKDKAYFGTVCPYDDLPQGVLDVNGELWKLLSEYQYRQFFSTEIREKDGKNFVIDLTCRHASPAGEVILSNCDNLAEVLWFGAEGKLIKPEFRHQFGAQLILTSEWAEEHCQLITFPEELRSQIKLYNHCVIDGRDWVIPQVAKMKHLGSIVTLADTPEEAVELCKEAAEEVSGFDVEYDPDALDHAVEEMKEFVK